MNREEFINEQFLNVKLSKRSIGVYVPRNSILNAVKECTPMLSGVLLDIGCGQMPYRELMMNANKALTQYIGLDLQSSSVHDTSIADIHWDGNTIPLENNTVNSAIATEVLEHSFYPEKTLLEINRVLKPGGTFFFTVPFIWPLHEVPYDAYRYTPFSLKMHLENAGFTSVNIRSLGGRNASMAQMLGLWASETKQKGLSKKIMLWVIKTLMTYLLKRDIKDHQFGKHCMMTGLYGTAIKK